MKTLDQYCPYVYILIFDGLSLAAAQIGTLIRKSDDWFLFVLQYHRNTERNMIHFHLFSLLFKLTKK